jgi:hypothetical protein
MLEKDPHMIAAMEKTQLHLARVIGAGSRAVRSLPFGIPIASHRGTHQRITPSGMNHYHQCNYPFHLVFLCDGTAKLEMTTPDLVGQPSFCSSPT